MATTSPEQEKDSVPFFPNHFMTEFYVVVGIVVLAIVFGALGMLSPVGLQPPADPLDTPLHVKPEWYFLATFEFLKYMPAHVGPIEGESLGLLIISFGGLLWCLVPWIDRGTNRRITATVMIVGVAALVFLTVMTYRGYFA